MSGTPMPNNEGDLIPQLSGLSAPGQPAEAVLPDAPQLAATMPVAEAPAPVEAAPAVVAESHEPIRVEHRARAERDGMAIPHLDRRPVPRGGTS